MTEEEKVIVFLRKEVNRHNKLYYVEDCQEITDREFDQLLRNLILLENNNPEYFCKNSPTQKVGGETISEFGTHNHKVPMLSIDNAFEISEVKEFLQKNRDSTGKDNPYTVEYKIDGVALSLIYENGILKRALTRGDGEKGDDVTENARTIRGVPLTLSGDNHPSLVEIRGETLIYNSDFSDLVASQKSNKEKVFANPRNASSGSLKLLDPKECSKRKLRFLAHGIGQTSGIKISNWSDYFDLFREWGIPSARVVLSDTSDDIEQSINILVDDKETLDYEVDGIVVKLDCLNTREYVGAGSKYPRWAVAYKWERYESVTTVESIEVQVGKTGVLTPVAHLLPTEIDGTMVSKSTLHNRDRVLELGIKVGDKVVVEKAGKIIPHIVRVEKHLRDGTEVDWDFPDDCPACGCKVSHSFDTSAVTCKNISCPSRVLNSVIHFASRGCMDISGLGDKLAEQLCDSGLVDSVIDLYTLKQPYRAKKVLALDRVGVKKLENLLSSIEESKNMPLHKVLYGLNIPNLGSNGSKILAANFTDIYDIKSQSVSSLMSLDDIGEITANSIWTYFNSFTGTNTIESLKMYGVTFQNEIKDKKASSNKLEGMTIVVTGAIEGHTRDSINELIESNGGKVSNSVSKNTSMLVASQESGSKFKKAKSLGIDVIEPGRFLNIVEGN